MDNDHIQRAKDRAQTVIIGTVRPTLQNAKDVMFLISQIDILAHQVKELSKKPSKSGDTPEFLNGLFRNN